VKLTQGRVVSAPFAVSLGALPLAVSLTIALAAGTSGQVASLADPEASPAPGSEATVAPLAFEDREEAMLAFAQCMREQGVEMDDPSPGEGMLFRIGPGADGTSVDPFDEAFVAAQEACSPILEAGRPELDPAAQQERLEQLLSMAQCIRDSGFPEFPDPVLDGDGRIRIGGGEGPGSLGIDPASEAFRAVMTGCSETVGLELPGPASGPAAPGPAGA
jgi:hypothetical protein